MPKSSLPGLAPVLCLVTRRGPGGTPALIARVEHAARAGVNLIQLREPDLDARALLALTRAALRAVEGTATRVIVNDRLDVALAAGAAGVHLRGASFSATDVRRLAAPPFLVGRSVHSETEAVAAEAAGGCDYLLFGTVFSSFSKPAGHPVAGCETLRRVCVSVRLPVLAIGGVSEENAPAALGAGAAGLAGIGLFEREDPAPLVARLRSASAG